MALRFFVSLFLLSFVSVGLFGLSATMPLFGHHSPHLSHCPLTGNDMPGCATTLDHIAHWQVAFAGTVILIVLFVSLLVLVSQLARFKFFRGRISPFRERRIYLAPNRPTLLQELFSTGLLNPRIP